MHDYRRTKPIADLPVEAVVQVYDENSDEPIVSADLPVGVNGENTILATMDREDKDSTIANAALVADLLATMHPAFRLLMDAHARGSQRTPVSPLVGTATNSQLGCSPQLEPGTTTVQLPQRVPLPMAPPRRLPTALVPASTSSPHHRLPE